MKTRLLTYSLLLLSAQAFAQIEKGTIAVGGGASIRYMSISQNNQKIENFGLSIAPNVGYFVVKNFMVGGQISYGLSSNNWQDALGKANSLSNSFGIGPELRYYVKIADKIYVHIMGNTSFTVGTGETKYKQSSIYNNSNSTIGANWNIGAGLSFFVTKSVAISLTPMYSGSYGKSYNNKDFSGTGTVLPTTNGFLLNAGFSIFIPPKGVEK